MIYKIKNNKRKKKIKIRFSQILEKICISVKELFIYPKKIMKHLN